MQTASPEIPLCLQSADKALRHHYGLGRGGCGTHRRNVGHRMRGDLERERGVSSTHTHSDTTGLKLTKQTFPTLHSSYLNLGNRWTTRDGGGVGPQSLIELG